MESKIMNVETPEMITPNKNDKRISPTREEEQDNEADNTQGNSSTVDVTINTTQWKIGIKNLIPSLTKLDMKIVEDSSMESTEDLGQHDLDRIANWEISNATTKRKLMTLIDHISRK